MDDKNVFDLVVKACKKYPKKIFLKSLDGKTNLDYEHTYNFVVKLNNYFNSNKILKKNKILVVFDNSILLSLLFLGITSSNRIFIPVNPEIGEYEFLHILKTSKPDFFFIDKKFKNKFKKFLKNKKINYIDDENYFILNIFKENLLEFNSNFNDISEILYTSGSTGKPKGVVLTHKSIMTNLHGLDKSLKLEKFKNFLAITPLFHNNGQFIPTLMSLKRFGTSMPIISKTSLGIFWDIVEEKKIHYSSVMATHISYLLHATKKKRKNNLKGLFCGGAKLDIEIQKNFEKKFKVKICSNYGLTETSSIIATENLEKKVNLGSVGKSLFNNKIKIINKNLFDGIKGEIIVKGDNVFKKYLNNKRKTNQVKKSGWLHTGDIGSFDKNKNLYIHDRIDNMVVISGENVYPTEIEKFSNLIKNIKLSVVTSIPDPFTQNKLILLYESTKKIDENKILKVLLKKITNFKIPKKIIHCYEVGLNEIPKAPNGKILRSKVREIVENYYKK